MKATQLKIGIHANWDKKYLTWMGYSSHVNAG